MAEIQINSHEIRAANNEDQFAQFEALLGTEFGEITTAEQLRALIIRKLAEQQYDIELNIAMAQSPLYQVAENNWLHRCHTLQLLQQFENDVPEIYLFFSRANFMATFLRCYPTTITSIQNIFSEKNDFIFFKENFYQIAKILIEKKPDVLIKVISNLKTIDQLTLNKTLENARNYCNWKVLICLCKNATFDLETLKTVLRVANISQKMKKATKENADDENTLIDFIQPVIPPSHTSIFTQSFPDSDNTQGTSKSAFTQ